MAIYQLADKAITTVPSTTFAELGLTERGDLQRLLRDQIEIIAPDTLVIAEEFGDWEESRRRIDLLGVDRDANLVVIELKRTEDGGHMELQAIRYAAMVSTMTFDRAVDIFDRYNKSRSIEVDARETILQYLEWDEPNDDEFASDVRIVLASAEFSKELTTAVLWLSERQLDIRCVRIKPYGTKQNVLIDVQQVIPLPEAQDYQVRLKEKQQKERAARKRHQEEWNGRDFYVSLGEYDDADWDDCRKYGFITASGGKWYTQSLDNLFVGARVFVNIPKKGFVGVGIVMNKSQTVDTFMVEHDGKQIPILQAPLQAKDMSNNLGDKDLCCNLVRVKWLKTNPRDDAYWGKGLFASQHSACKLRQALTISRLTEHFGITEE